MASQSVCLQFLRGSCPLGIYCRQSHNIRDIRIQRRPSVGMTLNLARRPLPQSLDSLARRVVVRPRAFPDPVLLISQNHNNRESTHSNSSPNDGESISTENILETVFNTAQVPTQVPASPRSDNGDNLIGPSIGMTLNLARRPLPQSLDSLARRVVARPRAFPDPVLLISQNHNNRESTHTSSSPNNGDTLTGPSVGITLNLARRPFPEILDNIARRLVARQQSFPAQVLPISQNNNNRGPSHMSSSPNVEESIPTETTFGTVSSPAQVPTPVPTSPRSNNGDTLTGSSVGMTLNLARRPFPEILDNIARRLVARQQSFSAQVLPISQNNNNRGSSNMSSSPIVEESIPAETTFGTVSSPAQVPTPVPASPLSNNGDTLTGPSVGITLNLARRPFPEILDSIARRLVARRQTVPAPFRQTSQNSNDLESIPTSSSPNNNSEVTKAEKNNFEKSSEADNHSLNKCIEDELQCNICQEILIKPTVLNCSHTFCHGCIESWTSIRNICPLCRASVTSKTYCRSLDMFLDKISPLLSNESQSKRQSRIEEYNITHN